MPRPAATPNQSPQDLLTIPQIRTQYRLPFCRRTVQKMFERAEGVRILGRREQTAADPRQRYRTFFVPRVVVERILREMLVTQ